MVVGENNLRTSASVIVLTKNRGNHYADAKQNGLTNSLTNSQICLFTLSRLQCLHKGELVGYCQTCSTHANMLVDVGLLMLPPAGYESNTCYNLNKCHSSYEVSN